MYAAAWLLRWVRNGGRDVCLLGLALALALSGFGFGRDGHGTVHGTVHGGGLGLRVWLEGRGGRRLRAEVRDKQRLTRQSSRACCCRLVAGHSEGRRSNVDAEEVINDAWLGGRGMGK